MRGDVITIAVCSFLAVVGLLVSGIMLFDAYTQSIEAESVSQPAVAQGYVLITVYIFLLLYAFKLVFEREPLKKYHGS